MAKTIKNFSQYAIAYTAWVFSWVIFVWFILLSRQVILAALRNYWVQGSFQREMSINFIDRAYIVVIGLLWIILMVIVESYFRNGIKKNKLYQRIGKILGPEITAIFLVDLLMALMVGFLGQPWTRWIILLVECLAGFALIWVGWFMKNHQKINTARV